MGDKDGVVVPDADRLVNFTVQGGGYNAGVAYSDFFSSEHWDVDGRTTFKGRGYLVVRSNRRAEKVIIKASTEGLPEQQIIVNIH